MSFAAKVILLVLLVGLSTYAARKREAMRRYRHLFAAAFILLGGALMLTTDRVRLD